MKDNNNIKKPQARIFKESIIEFTIRAICFKAKEGSLFIKYTLVIKALTQIDNGRLAWKSIVNPIPTTCMCFRSATSFVWGVPVE